MPKYTGAVKPEDWLSDYVTAVDIAGGNKRTGQDLLGRGSTACRLCRSTPGMISKKCSSRTLREPTSDRPARDNWPSASKARMSQTVTTSQDGPSCATRAKEWERNRPLATSRTNAEKEPY
jgi:hypothetical protein